MKKIKLGEKFDLPEDVITQMMAFLGRRGSGKTYGAGKFIEGLYDIGGQFIILDPVGVWWGLRLDADGNKKGLDITIFGGLHADVPLEPAAGTLIADLIVDKGISAIIDISQFEFNTDKAKFAEAFASRFFYRKKSRPSAVHLVIEEAQEVCPQNPAKGEERMLGAFNRIIKLGRNFGIGITLISQRPQEVNKKALNQTECLFAFQMTGLHERKAVEAWIADKGLDKNLADVLPKLEIGEPHVWSPQWLKISKQVKIGRKRTFNASSTPKLGAKPVKIKKLNPIDIQKIQKEMAETIERAKAEDPKELRKEIRSLEAQMRGEKSRKPSPPVDNVTVKRLQREANTRIKGLENRLLPAERNYQIQKDRADHFQKQSQYGESIIKTVYPILIKLIQVEKNITEFFKKPKIMPKIKAQLGIPKEILKSDPKKIERPKDIQMTYQKKRIDHPDILPFEEGQLNKCAKLIYGFLFTNSNKAFTKVQIAVMTGYSVKSGGFQSAMASLNTKELILKENNLIKVNPDNLDSELADEQEEFSLDTIKKKLNKCSKELLEVLIEDPSKDYDKEELALATPTQYSVTSGGFQSALAKLNTLGFIEKISGRIRLSKYIEELI